MRLLVVNFIVLLSLFSFFTPLAAVDFKKGEPLVRMLKDMYKQCPANKYPVQKLIGFLSCAKYCKPPCTLKRLRNFSPQEWEMWKLTHPGGLWNFRAENINFFGVVKQVERLEGLSEEGQRRIAVLLIKELSDQSKK